MPSYRQIVLDAVSASPTPISAYDLWGDHKLALALGTQVKLGQTLANLVAAGKLVRTTLNGVSVWAVSGAAATAPSKPAAATAQSPAGEPEDPDNDPPACEPSDWCPPKPVANPPVQVPSILPAINNLVEEIVETVVRGLEAALPAAIEAAVAHRVQQTLTTLPERILSQVPTKAKTKVLVVGLLPGLAKQIEEEFSDAFDLRFVEAAEKVGGRLKSLAVGSTHTLLMGDFIGHLHTTTVESAGVKPIVLHGGMTRLRDKLTELYANE